MAKSKPEYLTFLTDSDVIFDFISAREPFFADSERLFTLAEKGYFKAVTIPHLLVNVWQIRGHMDIQNLDMQKSMGKLLTIVDVLDEPAITISKALMALSSDFEDWVTVEAAIHHTVDGIVSRNVKHFKNSPIKCYTPSQLNQIFFKS